MFGCNASCQIATRRLTDLTLFGSASHAHDFKDCAVETSRQQWFVVSVVAASGYSLNKERIG
nr:MAG TPA: hypothetical protein [Caudoviricetes sp.]